jgi:methylenetetrahydrofolate dehydrogenase (NADP+) / methenyltetrahydrofolate cyclohydrolase
LPEGGDDMVVILDGKSLAEQINIQTSTRASAFEQKYNKKPGLAAILVGDNPSSKTYVSGKEKACKKFGLESLIINFDEKILTTTLDKIIVELNNDSSIHGILVQQPLPSHINLSRVVESIDPKKDVDGFHPNNLGKLLAGQQCLSPCTPLGIIELLKHYKIDIKGKNAVVIGRSLIVGKPISMLLLKEHATVTICHSKTMDLAKVASGADILVCAIGNPVMIRADYIKQGAVIIDVGISRISKEEAIKKQINLTMEMEKDFVKKGYTLVGDVDFASALNLASYITPVPGGIGPLTISMLLKNTVDAAYSLMGA